MDFSKNKLAILPANPSGEVVNNTLTVFCLRFCMPLLRDLVLESIEGVSFSRVSAQDVHPAEAGFVQPSY
jgi:hypothetical protein